MYASILTICLYIILISELLIFVKRLIQKAIRFNNNIDNYFSGDTQRGRWITNMFYFYVVYVLIACIDLVVMNKCSDLILTWIDTAVFVLFAIIVMNLQNLFCLSAAAFSGASVINNDDMHVDTSDNIEGREASLEEQNRLESIVNTWSSEKSKPFMKEGLTISEVARQMGISSRLLSNFINDVFEMNFNSWINSLRIDELKRIIAETPSVTVAELADMAGFTDASAMTRIFKRYTGKTPTQYKIELLENSDGKF